MYINNKTTKEELYKFFQVMQRYIKAGLSPNDSVERYIKSVNKPYLQEIGESILREMKNGIDFATTLKKFPNFCPDFLVGLLEVGQKSGQLGKILDEIVFHLEQDINISRKIDTAMLVPKITCVGMIIAATFAIMFVIPQLGELLMDSHVELPFITRLIIGIGETAQSLWWLFIIIGVALSFAYRYAQIKYADQFSIIGLKIPFYKDIAYNKLQYNFAKIMGLCITSGVRPNHALRYTAIAINNFYLKNVFTKAANDMVSSGSDIASAIAKHDSIKVINQDFYLMLKTGSESGNLGDIMFNEAENYRKEMIMASETIGDKVGLAVTIPGYVALIILFAAIEVPVITMLQKMNMSGGGF